LFAAGLLVLAVMGATTAFVYGGGLRLEHDAKFAVLIFTNLVGLILLGLICVAIERRSAEPASTLRQVASGAFCLGALAVVLATVYRIPNERGDPVYVLCGPQTAYDTWSLDYGLAMMAVALVTFVIPNRFTMTLTGLGISLGGAMQLWVAKLAMTGEAQLRAVSGDGMGKLMEQFPVIALIMGVILLLAGIGAACTPWFMRPGKGTL
jgi:hypothetical protein